MAYYKMTDLQKGLLVEIYSFTQIYSSLNETRQRVFLNGQVSTWTNVTAGVPLLVHYCF